MMQSVLFRTIIILSLTTSIVFVNYSYGMESEDPWGTMGAGLHCTGAPRMPCDDGGSGGGVSVSRGPECNEVAEDALANREFEKAKTIFVETLDKAKQGKNSKLQAACLHFLGLASKQQALSATSDAARSAGLGAAIGWYKQLVDLEPSNMGALQALLSIYEEQGKKSLADHVRQLIKKIEASQSSCLSSGQEPKLASGSLIPSSTSLVSVNGVATDICSTYKLDPVPSWTFSGVLTADNSLFLVDTPKDMILRYEFPQRKRAAEITRFERFKSPIVAPSTLRLMDKGYILEYGQNLLSLQNDENTTVWQFDVTAGARGSKGAVTSLNNWTVAGKYIFGFSDILFPNEVFKSGLFRAPLSDLGAFEVFPTLTFDLADPKTGFYLIGSPYLASIEERAYFLAMEDLPVIYGVDANVASRGPYPVYKFDEAYKRPGLLQSPNTAKVLEDSAKSTMPVGLYAAEHFLYVVMRAVRNLAVDWEVFKIDPAQGKLLSRRVLPMHSKHLVVIQGSKFWGFLEKGDLDSTGKFIQQIGNLWLIPAEKVEAEGSMPICPHRESVIESTAGYDNQSTDADTVQLHGVPLDIHE